MKRKPVTKIKMHLKRKNNRKKKAPVGPRRAKIRIARNGPYIVSGNVPLDQQIIVCDEKGYAKGYEQGKEYPPHESYALCRCGNSSTHPYCDGSHQQGGFDGTETAGHEKYITHAIRTEGPGLVLTDNESLCAAARFCDRMGGVWHLTKRSDNKWAKETAIQEATDCPAGRLVAWNKKTGKAIEPKHKPSISILEDPAVKASGPIWVKGGIEIESCDGKKYEVRNRVTLCRCGASENKPFCDGSHRTVGFKDGQLR